MKLTTLMVRGLATTAFAFLLSAGSAYAQYSSPVRDVDNPARQPASSSTELYFAALFGNVDTAYTVPAGKRLVIEHMSVRCYNGTAPTYFNIYSSGAGGGAHIVPLTNGMVSQPIRIYAGPGETVSVSAINYINASVSCHVNTTGYFVNLP